VNLELICLEKILIFIDIRYLYPKVVFMYFNILILSGISK